MARAKLPTGMFGSEAELCELLTKVARAAGFLVHAEVGGWDLVIVSRETGLQCGVQAKLRPNVDVLAQAFGTDSHEPGPAVHAVLVPVPSRAFLQVAARLDVMVIQGVTLDRFDLASAVSRAPRWQHKAPLWVPDVEIITPAGVASPRKVTEWKVNAVKLCLLIRERGYVTTADMRRLGQNRSWWFMRSAPILVRSEHESRQARYVFADPSSPLVPDLRWPEIVTALQIGERNLRDREARELEIIESIAAHALPPQSSIPSPVCVPRGRPRVRTKAEQSVPRQSMLPPPIGGDFEPISERILKPPANARHALACVEPLAKRRARA